MLNKNNKSKKLFVESSKNSKVLDLRNTMLHRQAQPTFAFEIQDFDL